MTHVRGPCYRRFLRSARGRFPLIATIPGSLVSPITLSPAGDDATHAAIRLQLVEDGVMRLAAEAFGGSPGGRGAAAGTQADTAGADRSPLLAASISAMGTIFAAAVRRGRALVVPSGWPGIILFCAFPLSN